MALITHATVFSNFARRLPPLVSRWESKLMKIWTKQWYWRSLHKKNMRDDEGLDPLRNSARFFKISKSAFFHLVVIIIHFAIVPGWQTFWCSRMPPKASKRWTKNSHVFLFFQVCCLYTKLQSFNVQVQQPFGALNSWHLRDLCRSSDVPTIFFDGSCGTHGWSYPWKAVVVRILLGELMVIVGWHVPGENGW